MFGEAPPPAGTRSAFVGIDGVLVAIVVGHRFPEVYKPSLESICERAAVPAYQYVCAPPTHIEPYYPLAPFDGLRDAAARTPATPHRRR